MSTFDIIRTTTAGSCFFDCLAYHLGTGYFVNRPSESWRIRQEVVNYVAENWERFAYATYDGEGKCFPSAEAYERYMSRPTSYACHGEIFAASQLFNITIVIIDHLGRRTVLNRGCRNEMSLLYSGEGGHYEYLRLVAPSHAAVVRGSTLYEERQVETGFWAAPATKDNVQADNVAEVPQPPKTKTLTSPSSAPPKEASDDGWTVVKRKRSFPLPQTKTSPPAYLTSYKRIRRPAGQQTERPFAANVNVPVSQKDDPLPSRSKAPRPRCPAPASEKQKQYKKVTLESKKSTTSSPPSYRV